MRTEVAVSTEVFDILVRNKVGRSAHRLFFYILGSMDEHFVVHSTQDEVARFLGISRVSVNKASRILVRLGLIKTCRGMFEVQKQYVSWDMPEDEE
jgi:DNA-binding MarR family transcriptional regulator